LALEAAPTEYLAFERYEEALRHCIGVSITHGATSTA
jgi:hypothetical protein